MTEHINTETGEVTLNLTTCNPETQSKEEVLAAWYSAVEGCKVAKVQIELEQNLRKRVAALFFPDPQEGTNTVELQQGWKMKLTHKIDRKLDEASLEAVKVQLREMGVNPDPLVAMKPNLDVKAYKGLKAINPEASKVFEQALTIKPASPTIELLQPK